MLDQLAAPIRPGSRNTDPETSREADEEQRKSLFGKRDEELREQIGDTKGDMSRAELEPAAFEEHVFRTIAELFGKEAGYWKGRGGGMHIADFGSGNLGATVRLF